MATVDELADRLTTSSVEITRGNRTFPHLECMAIDGVDHFIVALPGGDDDAHLKRFYRKLGANSRREAVAHAVGAGLIERR